MEARSAHSISQGSSVLTRRKKRITKNSLILFGIALPFFLLVLAFNYVPLFGWSYAFFDYKLGVPLFHNKFVGFEYFKLALTQAGGMGNVMKNTLVLSFLGIALSPLPVVFAIMVNEVRHAFFRKIVQTVTTLPNFISWVIVFSLAFTMFSIDGVVNHIAIKLGWIHQGYDYLGSSSIAWYFQTLLGAWKTVGWSAIIYLAAIAGIDQELYDAAKVDGAGRFRSIWHITVPGLMPTFVVLLLLAVSSMLSGGFEQYFMFYNPIVADKLEVLDYYVYRVGIGSFDYSYSTALGIFKTVVSVILLFICNFLSKTIRGQSII